jgi:hypothetical protein
MRVFTLTLILGLAASPVFGAEVLPPKRVRALVRPVFAAYSRVLRAETEETANGLENTLAHVFKDKSSVGDEALAVLLGFYLGEHSGEDISCELVSRGSRVLKKLEKYRSATIVIPGAPQGSLRAKSAEYTGLIARIRSGETCTREP